MIFNYEFLSDVLSSDETSDISNKQNCSTINANGVYVFTKDYQDIVTAITEKKRIDVVVADGCIAKICAINERAIIPNGNGFVLSFVGDEFIAKANEFSLGDVVIPEEIKGAIPKKYAVINGKILSIGRINGRRFPRVGAVLFDSNFGATTNTNGYGIEIIVEEGRVVSINHEGDSAIPESGFVLSIHFYDELYKTANDIAVGSSVSLTIDEQLYTVSNVKYTGLNRARLEDDIILYRDMDSTQTNEYGYEIAVDSDGNMVEDGYSGNIAVPNNGFVISGHGVGKKNLELIYAIGNRVILNEKDSSLRIIKEPKSILESASLAFENITKRFEKAKESLLNIKYSVITNEIDSVNKLLFEAKSDFGRLKIKESFEKCKLVISKSEELVYAMIESKRMENRAIWYRSHEKNDEEVLATIKKMKSLNINALYLETWYEGFCIGKKVDIEGITQPPRCEGYDALDAFIRIGHENGIEVHAWVENFFVGFYYDDGRSFYNKYFDKYKDKYLIDSKGRDYFYYATNNNKFIFLNPNDRECRDLILSIYEELITKYDLDGLQLDYIRFPELNFVTDDFGYNEDIIQGFVKATGIEEDPRTLKGEELDKWIQYRCDIITSFAEEVYQLIQRKNKKIWLSAATYPDIALFKRTIMQDVVSFVEKGIFDEIFSMSYGIDNAYVFRSVSDYVEKTRDKTFYSAGLATFLETTPMTFADQLPTAQNAGSDGISIFSLMSIHPERYQPQIEKGAFREVAVQSYKLSLAALEQMKYVSEKCENLSRVSETIDYSFISLINKECERVITLSNSLNFDESTAHDKLSWCDEAIYTISNVISEILTELPLSKERDSFVSDFDDLLYVIKLTKQRLEMRI